MNNQVERNAITDEFLDENYEMTTICGGDFYPSDILFHCDPIAYRCITANLMSEYEEEQADADWGC